MQNQLTDKNLSNCRIKTEPTASRIPPTFGASSGLCWRTVYKICMLLGFLALESSLKMTDFTTVPKLSRWTFSSSLQDGKHWS